MENMYTEDNDDGYDYYLYVYKNRIVKIVKTRKAYNVVKYPGVITYSKSSIPEGLTVEDLMYNYNYTLTQGYYKVKEEGGEENSNLLKRMTAVLRYLEKFQLLISFLKSSVISRAPDEDIYNRLLMHQIENYEKNPEDIGSLLEAEFKCSKYETYDTLIEAIKLKYKDASEIFAYIRYKDFEFKNLLRANNFSEVQKILVEMQQKLKI
jgi:hypothetical protein